MAVSVGLISKCLAGFCCVGVVGCGGGAVNDRGNETALDREVYEASGNGTGSVKPTGDTITIEAGKETELKISASTTSPSSKTWSCVIKGTVPADAGSSITSKIGEQFTTLKTNLGITENGTISGNPSTEDKGKKFFEKCRESRTIKESLMARMGTKAESTVNMEIVKVTNTGNEYKFDDAEFSKLYSTSSSEA